MPVSSRRTVLLGALLGFVACGGHRVDPSALHVISFEPRDKAMDAHVAMRVRFSAPVIPDAEVGRPLQVLPFKLEPAVGVSAHFSDRETLVVQPEAPLHPGTRYTLALDGTRGMQRETFSFVSQPLGFVRLHGVDQEYTPREPTLRLEFDQAVAEAQAAKTCRLKDDHGAIDLVVPNATVDETDADEPEPHAANAKIVTLRPSAPLEKGKAYRLACGGLTTVGGNDPLPDRELDTLHTYDDFTLRAHAPEGTEVAANDTKIELRFSTPVELDVARKHIHLEPRVAGFQRGTLEHGGTVFSVTLDLETDTDYKVVVDKDLVDRFGQALPAPVSFKFHTGDASPKLSMETGIFAVEPSGPGYPIWSRNIDAFDVQCAAVDRKGVVSLLTGEMNYDPWGGSSSAELEWKKLALHPVTTHLKPKTEKNKWILNEVQLEKRCGKATGLYLTEVRSMEPERYRRNSLPEQRVRRVLANVTNLGVMLKAGTTSGLVWVVGISDGKPVADARVELLTPQGKSAFRGKTDGDGLLRTPGTDKLLREVQRDKHGEEYEDYEDYRARRLIAIVEKDDEMAVIDGNWQNGIQVWNFGVSAEHGGGAASVRGFIQSDRGLYRPGETVHFKGLARDVALGRLPRVPTGKIELSVEDPRGAVVLKSKQPLSSFGGFWFDLPLSTEARVGDYHVSATVSGQTFREAFFVEEFKKAEVEIRAPGLVKDQPASRKVRFDLEAAYLFGAPAADAKVDWSVQSREHVLLYDRYPQYTFGASNDAYWSRYRMPSLDFVSDGTLTTDAKGRIRFAVSADKKATTPRDYVASVTVTDDTEQKTAKQVVITTHPSDFYLGLHQQEWVQAVGMPFAVNLVALDPAGRQVATTAQLSYVKIHGECRGGYFTGSDCTTTHDLEWKRTVALDTGGATTERIMPSSPGEFEIVIEAKDAHGRPVKTSSTIYVLGKGEAFWSGDESSRMTLIASKERYEPGETAKVVARTNLARATALVTLERNGILDAYVTSRSDTGSGFSIPIKVEHAPNVFASVALVSGRTGEGDRHRPQFKMGVVDLQVSSEAQRLKVEVTTEGSEFRPGQAVRGKIRVVDVKGEPVAAEVSLSVADEGVLQLIAYQTPDPMKKFYEPWGLGVDTATTLNRIARVADPNQGDSEEGGDSAPSSAGRIRSKFLSSAFWAPALRTNERGEASFGFALPDNLTAFRLMAVAADAGARFGSGDLRITVKKPVLLRAAVPIILTTGDTAKLGVVVHNYTDHDGIAVVTAHSTKGIELQARTAQVNVPKAGSRPVLFDAKAGFAADATLTFTVTLGSEKDALSVKLPISRGLVIDRQRLRSGEVNGRVELPVAWDQSDVADASSLRISVDSTGLAELTPALRALIEYPYGCLEQTLSRFIPLTKVKELADSLALDELKGERMRSYLATGAAKVVRHQHEDGLFSLWPGGQTDIELSIYALWGLNEARRAGVKIDDAATRKGLEAVQKWVNEQSDGSARGHDLAAMAAALLAELGKPDYSLASRLFLQRAQLSFYGRGHLLAALVAGKAPSDQIATLVSELTAAVRFDNGFGLLHETSPDDAALLHQLGSDVRSTAIVMRALVLVDAKSPIVAKLAGGLLHAQLPSGEWRTTQDNLYSIVALAAFAHARATVPAEVTVTLGDKIILGKRRVRAGVTTVELPLGSLRPGTLVVSSSGPAFVGVSLKRAHRDEGAFVTHGISVARRYVDAATGATVSSVKPGQLVRVVLTVHADADRRDIALVDPVPAGLEPVNPKLAGGEEDDERDRFRARWDHLEVHDGHVDAFLDRLPSGDQSLEYLARAVTAGSFTAAPTAVEAMYDPDVHGRSASVRFEVGK